MKYYSFLYALTFLSINNFIFCSMYIENKIPIVYSPMYNTNINPIINITKGMLQIQKKRLFSDDEVKQELNHVFPLSKYEDITENLKNQEIFQVESLIVPKKPSQEVLLKVHTQEYIEKIKKPNNIGRISNKPYLEPILQNIESKKLDDVILKPQRYATAGTVLATNIAIKNHCSTINMGGGFHHCDGTRCAETGCFCFYADVQQAIVEILNLYPQEKILVVDLDAHSGNGINYWLGQNKKYDNNIVIFDVCNALEFPIINHKNPNGDQIVGDTEVGKHTKYYRPIGANGEIIDGNFYAKKN